MKKIFLILILCSLNIFALQAQKPNIVFSIDKTPQKNGIAKLKILKNGNTASIEIVEEIGLVYKLYDTNKKKISESNTALRDDKFKMNRLRAVFEINGDIMVMMSFYKKTTPTLIRYLFDGSTGQLKSEVEILQLPEITGNDKYSISVYPSPDFLIEKDPITDFYAVGLCDIYSKDANRIIKIVHYSPKHEKINDSYLTFQDVKFKMIMLGSIYVNAGESVIITSYFSNSINRRSNDNGYYYISQLNIGSTIFNTKEIALTAPCESFMDIDCKLVYNKVKGNIKVVTKIADNLNWESYKYIIQTVNSKTIELSEKFQFSMQKASTYYAEKISSGNNYEGVIQSYLVDQNGNNLFLTQPFNVIEEQMTLTDIGITYTTPQGTELFGQIIPYSNTYINKIKSNIYMNASKGYFSQVYLDEYRGVFVSTVAGINKNYILLNNTPVLFERSEKERDAYLKPVWMNTPMLTSFLYTIGPNGEITKEYLFGKPVTEKEAKYGLFHTADYNPETGMYATQVVEFLNGKKVVSIAWIALK